MILGICGGSGAGKTTLVKRLASHFQELKPAVFSMDNYYRPLEEQYRDETGEVNFDLPTAIDEQRLTRDLTAVVSGQTIQINEYQFNTVKGPGPLLKIAPSPLIIVEGLFLFHFQKVAQLIDFSVFIDVDPEIQLARRQKRDQELRGCSEELIRYQWEKHVTPSFNEFLLPYRHTADFIFRNDHEADGEFDRLIAVLNPRIA